jgi:hypothetical protein
MHVLFVQSMATPSGVVYLLAGVDVASPPYNCSICWCLTTDSLPRGYPGQLFGLRRVLELDGERRDIRFILVRTLDRDRVITLRPVGVSLCVGLIVLSYIPLQGCPQPLFISVEKAVCGYNSSRIQRRCPELDIGVTSIEIWLVWPILLIFGVVDATPLLAPVCGLGQGP